MGTIILSVLVAHTAWHWMTERGSQLLQFPAPRLSPSSLAEILGWVMAGVTLAAVIWLTRVLVRARAE
jgi:hypothetical protein